MIRLYESSDIQPSKGKRKFISHVLTAGQPTKNKRVYGLSAIKANVSRLAPRIRNKTLVGRLNHSPLDTKEAISLLETCHIITDMHLKNDELWIEGFILEDTPAGKVAFSLLNSGSKMGCSICSVGKTREDSNGIVLVEDFQLLAIDLVQDPAFSESEVVLTEQLNRPAISPSEFLIKAILSSANRRL